MRLVCAPGKCPGPGRAATFARLFLASLPNLLMRYAPAAAFRPAFLAASLLASCSAGPGGAASPTGGALAANDFENLDGWLADSPALATLTRTQAHSGRYSTMVGGGHDFSLGYNNTLSRLAPAGWPARLRVSAWVWLPSEQAAAKLVTEVKGAGAHAPGLLLWEGLDLPQAVKVTNQWRHVEQTITLPPTATANSRLLVYLWRADSREPVYLDDLQIALAGQ